jgi:hypothetical protein
MKGRKGRLMKQSSEHSKSVNADESIPSSQNISTQSDASDNAMKQQDGQGLSIEEIGVNASTKDMSGNLQMNKRLGLSLMQTAITTEVTAAVTRELNDKMAALFEAKSGQSGDTIETVVSPGRSGGEEHHLRHLQRAADKSFRTIDNMVLHSQAYEQACFSAREQASALGVIKDLLDYTASTSDGMEPQDAVSYTRQALSLISSKIETISAEVDFQAAITAKTYTYGPEFGSIAKRELATRYDGDYAKVDAAIAAAARASNALERTSPGYTRQIQRLRKAKSSNKQRSAAPAEKKAASTSPRRRSR